MTVNSIAALRVTNGTTADNVCTLLGYYAPGDGGGGSFYWDDTSGDQDNGVTIIKAQAATGRWKRIHDKVMDVRWLGAKGDGTSDDLAMVQQGIDFCSTNGYTLKLSAGTYLCNGTLWLKDYTVITGEGNNSVLKIGASGQIRGEKGGVRGYGFNDNYATEVIPPNTQDYGNLTLTANVAVGATELPVGDTTKVSVGDLLYTFNGVTNAWQILSPQNGIPAEWNNYDNPLGQMEIFRVKAKTATTITINRPTAFACPQGTAVSKLIGVKEVALSNFKIDFVIQVSDAMLLEQTSNCRISGLVLNNGGISLYKCAWNTINNCIITTTVGRCIMVTSFGTGNRISNNTCYYTTGGDAAILVMMANNNSVCNNTVEGSGVAGKDEIGVCCHARSYNNVIANNLVRNMSAGYGLYYGCWANTFDSNSSSKCFVDYSCYYAGKASISGANSYGSSEERERQDTTRLKRSVAIFYCREVTVTNGILEKNLQIEGSKNIEISGNTLVGDILLIVTSVGANIQIRNNRVTSPGRCITVTSATYNIAPPYQPVLIEGNILEGNYDKLIYLERVVHVYIRQNIIKNNNLIGIGFNDIASFTSITGNHFMNCSIAVDFSAYANNVSTSYACVKDNRFFNCTALYQSWLSPVTNNFVKSGGVNGFEIMNLGSVVPTVPDKKWVYIGAADGLTGPANWKEVAQ
ncbi:NosD domain-containing protein [Chitinophaga sp. 212800010-3]|uniref:NosD domain-containing protein n=1 Tax=unclassified Chitinophaga TaxID=2619133 RepID=UPI002DE836E2|nr:Pectate-lyase-3 domain-containing protein [Chitinophaga sp. 212800010-3]